MSPERRSRYQRLVEQKVEQLREAAEPDTDLEKLQAEHTRLLEDLRWVQQQRTEREHAEPTWPAVERRRGGDRRGMERRHRSWWWQR